jgi:glutathione S-transferase
LALEKGGKYKSLFAFEKKIAAEAHIAKYLKSERRQEFSSGLFRKYDELDGEA